MYGSDELPLKKEGNRWYLTAQQVVDDPEVAAFIKRFQNFFDHDILRDIIWFVPDGGVNA